MQKIEQKIEILAPVGGEEQLQAAVRSGADAVYLGMNAFNARRNASNFDRDALHRAVSYCHARNVSVHVTLNICVIEREIPALQQTIQEIASCGVDAVIVQDLAVAKLVKEICPSLPMHASTQLAVHNVAGTRFLQQLGFSRVVLARELSVKEIKAICEATPLEVEVFIHGALCMCASGMCTLSSVLGGRSGNRGLCAQPCRLDFQAGNRSFALSLKDLSGLSHMKTLSEAGVSSFKIEGRMKRPEYVAAAVSACVSARDGQKPDMESLQSVFSRSGFTDGYLTAKRDISMFGFRTKEDVISTASVLKKIENSYRNERNAVPVSVSAEYGQEELTVTVSDGINTAVNSVPIHSFTVIPYETCVSHLERSFSKTGNTPFFLENLFVSGSCRMIPVSVLNSIRRNLLENLLSLRGTVKPYEIHQEPLFHFDAHIPGRVPKVRLRFRTQEQIVHEELADRIILPVESIDVSLIRKYGEKLVGELPRLLYPGDESELETLLFNLKQLGLLTVEANNIYGFAIAKEVGLAISAGFGMNVMNTVSLCECGGLGAGDVTLSFELPHKEIRSLRGTLPRGILVYGYLPLMYFRACPMQKGTGCGNCDGQSFLKDRKGIAFRVGCEKRKYSILYNSVPLSILSGEVKEIDFETLYFTYETPEVVESVISAYCSKKQISIPHTKGLYFRELL